MRPGTLVVVNVSGRGDKDLFITAPRFDREDWLAFLESEATRIKDEDNALAGAESPAGVVSRMKKGEL